MDATMTIDDDQTAPDRRRTDKWHVDKTINVPTVAMVLGAAMAAITWGNRVDNDILREREARVKIEASLVEQRSSALQVRTELLQQQSQSRIERQQQISEVKADVTKGLDKIETKLERGMLELRNDVKAIGK